MTKIPAFVFLCFLSLTGFCQTDTIFSRSGKIVCKVLKIKVDSIIYVTTASEKHQSIFKKEVDKIIYKNGKTVSIKNERSVQQIEGISNFEDVVITMNESEIKSYRKIRDVEAKYTFSSDPKQADKNLDKSLRVLKIQAAMQGANIIYLPDYVTQITDTTNKQLTGVAYCSALPSVELFEKLTENKNNFKSTDQWYMYAGKTDVYQLVYNGTFRIDEIYTENDIITITGELKSFPKVTSFRLISLTTKAFMLYFEVGTIAYNVRVNL
ncbi:hypothetical protein [Cytophaga hutchinsonii]|jgi:hypothetical protein|uniref:Uncharacterized protein n=1 Tax=Cytophaga hutchinsonii (strain ATCC 33406 / DSM 1761 / CIP 103989 / NBRC 15051 / NCIMB 9469 / D465) TaxID=269798 RepID=A0A6N4SRU1_CYTH3|nr:hypothetical protein [Cytophaga hutchinsonii]ABG59031.1 hypothetical protein CHU_1764 [Cytophaga hutchinsonii ATCC 33406]SFX38553.1 hypothetical protein SAMN04487930_103279 [Cytophaga hutchinsonii ATCC 33406]